MGRTLNKILAQEKPEVVAAAKLKAADMLVNIHLDELRKQVEVTQKEALDGRRYSYYRSTANGHQKNSGAWRLS